MKTIDLQPNHRRSFSSTLFLLEKMVVEIREVLSSGKALRMQQVEKDLSQEKKQQVFEVLDEIEVEIRLLADKYQLVPQEMVESHFLNSRKSKAWEILNDSLSKRMNGFGAFPPELKEEFDSDIARLLQQVAKL